MSSTELSANHEVNEEKKDTNTVDSDAYSNEYVHDSNSANVERVEEPSFERVNEEDINQINSDTDSIDRLCSEQDDTTRYQSYRRRVTSNRDQLPSYMRETQCSLRREQLRIEEDRRRSIAKISQDTRFSTVNVRASTHSECPHYMKETRSFRQYSLVPSPQPHIRPSQIREVDPENKPRYMEVTEAYKKQVEKDEGKKKVLPQQIREVDPENKPRYMEVTEAYKKQVEKDEGKKKVLPQQIREVDPKNKPRYMEVTEAYKKKVEKVVPPEEPPKRKIKEVDVKNKPRYMQETKAWEERVKEDTRSVRSISSTSIRCVNTDDLPRYMQLTKACKQHLVEEKAEKPVQKPVRSLTGTPHFSKSTASYNELIKRKEEEKQEREKRLSEIIRQRESLAVRRERWAQSRLRTESIMEQHRYSCIPLVSQKKSNWIVCSRNTERMILLC